MLVLLVCLVQAAHARDLATNQINDAQHSIDIDKLSDKLVNKLVGSSATLARAPQRLTPLPGQFHMMKPSSMSQAYGTGKTKLRLAPKMRATRVSAQLPAAQEQKMTPSSLAPSRSSIAAVVKMGKLIKLFFARSIVALCASLSAVASNATTKGMPAALSFCHGSKDASAAGLTGLSRASALPLLPLWWFEDLVKMGTFKMGFPGVLSVGVFLSPIDVMQRILKDKGIGKLPLLPYSAMMVNGALWSAYGLLKNSPPIWAPNVVGFICGLLYTSIFVANTPSDADWLPGKVTDHFLGAGALISAALAIFLLAPKALATNVLGIAAQIICVIMFGGPLVAVGTILKEKSTRSLPLGFTLLTFANCGSWLYYGLLYLNDPYIYIPNFLGFALAIGQLALFARFGVQTS